MTAKLTPEEEKRQIAIRCGASFLARVDRIAEAMAEEDGGIGPGRSAVIRKAAMLAFPQLESLYRIDERRAS